MSASELEDWLNTRESLAAGWKGADGNARESIGHASGRRIVEILGRRNDQLDESDYVHMRKVVGYVHRHSAQRPANIYTSRWRYSLMNWGHDPVKGEGMVNGYCDNIEKRTLENEDFRRVLYTGHHLQLVAMTLQPGDEIGEEVHDDRDQFFRIEEGEGAIDIDGVANAVQDDFAVIVPAGASHNVRNTGNAPLRLYTIYAPPEHLDGIVQSTKAEADRRHSHEEWDGKTTE